MSACHDPDPLGWAMAYIARGWPVLPIRPRSKVPATKHGCLDATLDWKQAERWWTAHPDHGVGIATGHAFDVIDVDGEAALDALDRAAPIGTRVVYGPIVVTGRPGVHLYVEATGRGNTAGLLLGVDFRGKGGYVIAPPSVHPNGTPYLWDLNHDCCAELNPVPAWLLDVWDRRRDEGAQHRIRDGGHRREHGGGTPYGRKALESELGRLALVGVGHRNDELCRASYRLGQLVAGGQLEAHGVAESLLVVAARTGLGEGEAVATIKSGMAAGMASPRRAPENSL